MAEQSMAVMLRLGELEDTLLSKLDESDPAELADTHKPVRLVVALLTKDRAVGVAPEELAVQRRAKLVVQEVQVPHLA
jgi:hypothetical protein